MYTKVISRKEVEISEAYADMMQTEKHHDHVIEEMEVTLTWHWKTNEEVYQLKKEIGLQKILRLFEMLGLTWNSEIVRKFYRDIGYSLDGYRQMFYYEKNNEAANDYRPPLAADIENLPEEQKFIITLFCMFLERGYKSGLITKTQYWELKNQL